MGVGSKRNPATGRKRREAVNRGQRGKGPERRNGTIVPKGRLAFKRKRNSRSS